MTDFTYPTLSQNPNGWQFGQRSNCRVHTSGLSGNVQTLELPGARWTVGMNYTNVKAADAALLDAVLAQLRGQSNRLVLYDLVSPVPLGTMQGTMTVSGAIAQGATTCSVTAGAGQAGKTLLRGDKLNIGGELKMIVADATANGSGVIALTIEPPFRGAISNGASVVWQNPTTTFMNAAPDWRRSTTLGQWSTYALDLVERW